MRYLFWTKIDQDLSTHQEYALEATGSTEDLKFERNISWRFIDLEPGLEQYIVLWHLSKAIEKGPVTT